MSERAFWISEQRVVNDDEIITMLLLLISRRRGHGSRVLAFEMRIGVDLYA